MNKNSKSKAPKNAHSSRNAVVETIKPLTGTGKVVKGKKVEAPKPKAKKKVEQGRTFEGSAVREAAKGTAKKVGAKPTEQSEAVLRKAMAAKREYYAAKAKEESVKVVTAAAEALDSLVEKFSKAAGLKEVVSINIAKQIAREWKCFDGK